MAKIAYVRVSTEEQNEARQVEALKKHGIDKWYTEKVSGKSLDRPQLRAMLDYAREGDTIYIHDLSRISRSLVDLMTLLERMKQDGIELVSNKENIDTATPTGKLILTVIAAINEFERENMLERQREGIAVAKRDKKYKGRKPKRLGANREEAAQIYEDYCRRRKTKSEIAQMLDISRPTLDRLLKEYERELAHKV